MQWLRRARFGTWNRKGDVSLQQLKVIYSPQVQYSTFQFTIPPALAKRLAIPGGYHGNRTILTCVTDGRADQKGFMAMRCEGQAIRMAPLPLSGHAYSRDFRYFHFDLVQVCCSTRGATECPKSLAEIQAFVKSIILERPIPEWYLQLLDKLHEAEESVIISSVNHCNIWSSQFLQT